MQILPAHRKILADFRERRMMCNMYSSWYGFAVETGRNPVFLRLYLADELRIGQSLVRLSLFCFRRVLWLSAHRERGNRNKPRRRRSVAAFFYGIESRIDRFEAQVCH